MSFQHINTEMQILCSATLTGLQGFQYPLIVTYLKMCGKVPAE